MTFASGFHNRISAGVARRRLFRRTYNELNALSERELEDLGLSRWNIADIAREAAYGK